VVIVHIIKITLMSIRATKSGFMITKHQDRSTSVPNFSLLEVPASMGQLFSSMLFVIQRLPLTILTNLLYPHKHFYLDHQPQLSLSRNGAMLQNMDVM
jgi:hypothetical protein